MTTPGLRQEEGFEVLSPPLRMIICLHSTHLLRTLWAELQGKAAAKGQGMNAVVHVSAGEGTGGIKGWQAKLTQRLLSFPRTTKPTCHTRGRLARGCLMTWPQLRPHTILLMCPLVTVSSHHRYSESIGLTVGAI